MYTGAYRDIPNFQSALQVSLSVIYVNILTLFNAHPLWFHSACCVWDMFSIYFNILCRPYVYKFGKSVQQYGQLKMVVMEMEYFSSRLYTAYIKCIPAVQGRLALFWWTIIRSIILFTKKLHLGDSFIEAMNPLNFSVSPINS